MAITGTIELRGISYDYEVIANEGDHFDARFKTAKGLVGVDDPEWIELMVILLNLIHSTEAQPSRVDRLRYATKQLAQATATLALIGLPEAQRMEAQEAGAAWAARVRELLAKD